MKKINILVALILFSIILSSCEDFFETSIEIDPPKYEKLLTIVGKASAGDDELILKISETIGVLENDSLLKGNSGVKVVAKLNNQLLNVSEFSRIAFNGVKEPRYAISFPQKLKAGDKLNIEASYKNLPIATVESTIPSTPKIENKVFTMDAGKNGNGDDISKVTFDYTTVEPNIYLVGYYENKNIYCSSRVIKDGVSTCTKYDTNSYTQLLTFQDPNAAFNYYLKKPNTDLTKKEIVITFQQGLFVSNPNNQNQIKPFITLEIHNKEGATPVNLKSNIVNGYGILLLSNNVKIEL
jgi:hypothetical protein